jgi:riboflavin synthase
MFTGIVTAMGALVSSTELRGDRRLEFRCEGLPLDTAEPGDSIAVSGTCLTMLKPHSSGFSADVSVETLSLTTLGSLATGDPVNLELALRAGDRMGGHMVSGHVDGLAVLRQRSTDARAERFVFQAPMNLSRYIAKKGSVCLDGVSLTVNGVEADRFEVCLIPHTLEVTTLGRLQAGDPVNLEIDIVARYLERLQLAEESP